MWNTFTVQESAREIASVALSAEQDRHTGCVSHRLQRGLIVWKLDRERLYVSRGGLIQLIKNVQWNLSYRT